MLRLMKKFVFCCMHNFENAFIHSLDLKYVNLTFFTTHCHHNFVIPTLQKKQRNRKVDEQKDSRTKKDPT